MPSHGARNAPRIPGSRCMSGHPFFHPAAEVPSHMTTTTAKRLTAPEAESLWRAWKTRSDSQARDRLILSYAPMVKYLASRKVRELPTHCELDDLVSCG